MPPLLIVLIAAAILVLAAMIHRRVNRPIASNTLSPHANGRPGYVATDNASLAYLVVEPDTLPEITLGTVANQPLGVAVDVQQIGEHVAVALFGVTPGTLTVRASAAITAGTQVVTAANGRVQTLPVAAGTYWLVGRALTAATAADGPIELQHCYPIKITVS